MEKIIFDPKLSKIISELNTDVKKEASSELLDLLKGAVEKGASDLLLVADVPPVLRIQDELTRVGDDVLTADKIKALTFALLEKHIRERFIRERAVDFCFEIEGLGRFRCNLHYQRRTVSASIRVFPKEIIEIDELGLPASMERLINSGSGLVLITGPTGCGKTTTMASLIHRINRTQACHVITIEDPVEYRHRPIQSVIEQIEIGTDSFSFLSSLKHALRQDPDVILVGEMRDLETMQLAITAAETGHLVFATVHTNNAAQTVDRIVDVFPPGQQEQIRIQLSNNLEAVLSQQLLARAGTPGRICAMEIMVASSAIRNLIRESKAHQITSIIQTSAHLGMQTMDQCLRDLYQRGLITYEDAMARAMNVEELKKMIFTKGEAA